MDRFMDNADPTRKAKSKAIQQELNATRDRLRLLVEGKVRRNLTCRPFPPLFTILHIGHTFCDLP